MQILTANPEQLLGYITPLLMCDNEEAQVEAARAYGNFSRTHEAREYMQTVRRVVRGLWAGADRQAGRMAAGFACVRSGSEGVDAQRGKTSGELWPLRINFLSHNSPTCLG